MSYLAEAMIAARQYRAIVDQYRVETNEDTRKEMLLTGGEFYAKVFSLLGENAPFNERIPLDLTIDDLWELGISFYDFRNKKFNIPKTISGYELQIAVCRYMTGDDEGFSRMAGRNNPYVRRLAEQTLKYIMGVDASTRNTAVSA